MSSKIFSQNWEPHHCGSFLIFGRRTNRQRLHHLLHVQAIDVTTGDANSSVDDAIFKFRAPPGNGRAHISARPFSTTIAFDYFP
ncbi:MAG: hypothetical protein WAK48_32995 [Candidatus Acidiferrum sp.]